MITVLTPTYNRGNLIKNLYNSLCEQTNKDFQWLIIDDGSSDKTNDIVDSFAKDEFLLEYYQKNNGGKHTALNYAHSYIKGDWVFVVDSDDILTTNAIDLIYAYIDKYKNNSKIGCLSFQKIDTLGNISSVNKSNELISNAIDYRINQNIKGEQAEVYRTDIFKNFKFPVYENEKFLEENYLHINAALVTSTVYISKVIYIFEYLENGLTKQGRRLKIMNPKGEMLINKLYCLEKFKMQVRFKGMILYIVYSLFNNSGIYDIYKNYMNKKFFIINFIIGYFVYIFCKLKYQK